LRILPLSFNFYLVQFSDSTAARINLRLVGCYTNTFPYFSSQPSPPSIFQLEQSGEKGNSKQTRSAHLTDPTLPLKNSNS